MELTILLISTIETCVELCMKIITHIVFKIIGSSGLVYSTKFPALILNGVKIWDCDDRLGNETNRRNITKCVVCCIGITRFKGFHLFH